MQSASRNISNRMRAHARILVGSAIWAAIAISLFGQEMFGQEMPPLRPNPGNPASQIGAQLIAWSDLKKPQPVSQPALAYGLRDFHEFKPASFDDPEKQLQLSIPVSTESPSQVVEIPGTDR
jgi:hypothetical protein